MIKCSFSCDFCAGEYLAHSGERLNGADMFALALPTSMSSVCSNILFIIYNCPLFSFSLCNIFLHHRGLLGLAKLVTDDPLVIDSTLAEYGDMAYPD